MTPNWFAAWPVQGAEEWLASLQSSATGGLNFLHPEDLHVTLAFLGRYEPSMVGKIDTLLRGMSFEDIPVTPGQCVARPQERRFSALTFNLDKGRLAVEAHIAKRRDRICREAGAKIDTRAAEPHITFARPDRRIGEDDRAAALEWIAQLPSQSGAALVLGHPRVYTWADRGSLMRYRLAG